MAEDHKFRHRHPFIFAGFLFIIIFFTAIGVYDYMSIKTGLYKSEIMRDAATYKARYLELENRLLIIRARALETENNMLQSRSCQKYGMTEI